MNNKAPTLTFEVIFVFKETDRYISSFLPDSLKIINWGRQREERIKPPCFLKVISVKQKRAFVHAEGQKHLSLKLK